MRKQSVLVDEPIDLLPVLCSRLSEKDIDLFNEALGAFLTDEGACLQDIRSANAMVGGYTINMSGLLWDTLILAAELLVGSQDKGLLIKSLPNVIQWLRNLKGRVARLDARSGQLCVFRGVLDAMSIPTREVESEPVTADQVLAYLPCKLRLATESTCVYSRQWGCQLSGDGLVNILEDLKEGNHLVETENGWSLKSPA